MSERPASPSLGSPPGSGYEYAAFISYRHAARDKAAAAWLLRAIESYRVPRDLRRARDLPAKLGKVFRDEDELPSSEDLNDSIVQALEQSRVLIVVCSPDLKHSRWCRKEIRQFREWDRPVLPLIVAGDLSSADPAHDAYTDELRTRLRREVGPDGTDRFIAEETEPIAADLRPQPGVSMRHVRRVARVKIIAGLLGIKFDDLWQRERRRRRQGQLVWGAVGAIALAAALVGMRSVRTSREDAKRQRVARVAADLTSAALSARDLDAQTRTLLALHALRLHDETGGGDLSSIDSTLRASLKELGPLCDSVEWSTSVPVESVLPIDTSAPGDDGTKPDPAALAELTRYLRAGGTAGGVMSVAFLPGDAVLAFGLCTTPMQRSTRPFGLWSFARCDAPTLAGFAPRVPHMRSLRDLAGIVSELAPTLVCTSPTGRLAALVSSDVVIRLRENDELDESNWFWPDPLPERTTAIAFDPTSTSDSFRLAYAGSSMTVRVCSVVLSKSTTQIDLSAGALVRTVMYRHDGGGIVAGCEDGSVRVWTNLTDGRAPSQVLNAHRGRVNSVAFRGDGAMLASAGDDGVVALWDLARPDAPLHRIRPRAQPERRTACAVTFSSRGDLAIGWSGVGESGFKDPEKSGADAEWARPDGAVYLYRATDVTDASGPSEPVLLLPGNSGGVRSLAFNIAGSLLAAGCEDLSIHVWVAMPNDLVAFAKRFVTRDLTPEEWTRFTQDRATFRPVR